MTVRLTLRWKRLVLVQTGTGLQTGDRIWEEGGIRLVVGILVTGIIRSELKGSHQKPGGGILKIEERDDKPKEE